MSIVRTSQPSFMCTFSSVLILGPKTVFFWAPVFKWVSAFSLSLTCLICASVLILYRILFETNVYMQPPCRMLLVASSMMLDVLFGYFFWDMKM